MKNFYLCKGKVITASSKAKAIQVIATSTSDKKLEDFLVKCLKGYVSEENVRKFSKEIDGCFTNFTWDRQDYELNIYRDQGDSLDSSIRDIDTFEAYFNTLWDAYMEYVSDEFYELADRIKETLKTEGVEINGDVSDLSLQLQDYISVDYPNYLDDKIEVNVTIKNTKDIKKFLYGSSSNINIATKLVKGHLDPDVEKSLIQAIEEQLVHADSFEELSKEDKIKEAVSFLDKSDKLKREELITVEGVELTIREYLSIIDRDSDFTSKKLDKIDLGTCDDCYINYGYDCYNFDSTTLKLGKLKVDDILDAYFQRY